MNKNLSIILPAKNEARSLAVLLPKLNETCSDAEVIVVNDGSTDETGIVCAENNVIVINHPVSMGNGAAIKSGVRAATGDLLVFMDADGQHDAGDIEKLLLEMDKGYDMVVGSRGVREQANVARLLANLTYNKLASWATGQKIVDLTSGFRVAKAEKFRRFLYLLPNGFSYPATITMAFFRSGFSVGYLPVDVKGRVGRSHIQPFKDGIRFFLIIFKVATLYSPLKLFFPVCTSFMALGIVNYIYTYTTEGRFTNMSALLFIVSVLIFLMGLVSEQITSLIYMRDNDKS